eukprot:scaffold3297_cov327-Prasinococcus_capsulatus_cf.AAC.5
MLGCRIVLLAPSCCPVRLKRCRRGVRIGRRCASRSLRRPTRSCRTSSASCSRSELWQLTSACPHPADASPIRQRTEPAAATDRSRSSEN